jgi:hypothetical protein
MTDITLAADWRQAHPTTRRGPHRSHTRGARGPHKEPHLARNQVQEAEALVRGACERRL